MSLAVNLLSSDELLQILIQSPNATAIYTTEDVIIQMANDAMIGLWGKDRSVVGKPLEQAVPELQGQPFIAQLQKVWNTGITYEAKDTPAELLVNGRMQTLYFDFIYRPIPNADGSTYCILHTAADVTSNVNNRRLIAEQEQKERELNEELAVVNEELISSNEELVTINEELKESYNILEKRSRDLRISEQKARYIIEDAPVAMAIFAGRELIIETANTKMLELWDRGQEVINQPLGQALPELEGQPFLQLMDEVFTTGQPYYGNEVKAQARRNQSHAEVYYNFVYQPIKNEEGQTLSILSVAYEVTEQITIRSQIEHNEYRLNQMIMTAPMGMTILKGRELIVEIANQPMLNIWGRTSEQIIGRRLMEVFPELVDQPFPKMLAGIFDTGQPLAISEIQVDINVDGALKQLYVDFTYEPLFDLQGRVESVMATVIDITEAVTARKQLERNELELQDLNEQLTALNEEQQSANEELVDTNHELSHAQNQLRSANGLLAESENRLRNMLEQAPIGMSVLTGPDLITEMANDAILKIWGRTASEVLGRPHHEARPELKGQQVHQWLEEVYFTGKARINTEFLVKLYDKGSLREAFVNSVYQPLKDDTGMVTGVLVMLDDVTERVKARKEIEQVQEMFNLAVQAAELGTFDLNPATSKFTSNDLLKSWFGLSPQDEVELDKALAAIHEDDRDRVTTAILNSMTYASGGNYDTEYTIVNPLDSVARIVRAKGKAQFNDEQLPVRLSGTVQDITERKLDENRKNDFIAMVSHELKTPLTSAKAYVQMLNNKAKAAKDSFTGGALDKVEVQINKMNTLIKGFLDVARIESGKIQLNMQQVALNEILHEAVEDALLLTQSHDIVTHECDNIVVDADRDKIGQVINNFLTNAIKYSPKGKKITLNCKRTSDRVQVSVTDEGMGIKPQDISKLFDRFYRVESKHTKTISGFGIGLYLCAEIIQRHNGKIWVESQIGKGSTFFFSLPVG